MSTTTVIRTLHEKSELAERPELDFFTAPQTDASIRHTFFEEYMTMFPLSTEKTQNLRIIIPADPVHFIDLSRSFLEIKLHGVGKSISKRLPPEIVVAPSYRNRSTQEFSSIATNSPWMVVNNIAASLFEYVKIECNGIQILDGTNYAYEAMITKLLNCTTANKDSVQRLAWFTLEEANVLNTWSFGGYTELEERNAASSDGKTFTVFDRIYIPIAYAHKFIPNNVNISLHFKQADSEFTIIAASPLNANMRWGDSSISPDEIDMTPPDLRLSIDSITYHVCKVRPYEHILERLNKRLEKEPALFFFPKRDTRNFLIPPNTQSFHMTVYTGRKPQSVTFCMVADQDVLGNIYTSPFNFRNFDLRKFTLTVNNLLPTAPLDVDLAEGNWEAAYRLLSESTGHNTEFGDGPMISPTLFKNGNFLLHYSLSNNLSTDKFLESAEMVLIHITLEFKKLLPQAVRVIMLARIDEYIEVWGPERKFVGSFTAA